MTKSTFTFSDLIAGYVTNVGSDSNSFGLRTSDGREFLVKLTPTVFAEFIRNLGEGYRDASASLESLLTEGQFLFIYGVFYPEGEGTPQIEAKHIVFAGESTEDYRFEEQDWWINQVRQLADYYLDHEFGDGPIDYEEYRTNLDISGDKSSSGRQETDTISRLVYGFASAYLMTGEDRYLEAAEKGTTYLRENLRFKDHDNDVTYWYHAVDVKEDGSKHKILASEFGDDYHAVPCYEQIYALAGPVQTYRITGEKQILDDAEATIRTFDKYFKDSSEKGGYYSHIDPVSLSAHDASLGKNQAKKNWNSVGDHAPAYLINLFLASGKKEYADFLEYNFDLIAEHFQDYDNSPFVQERFFDDWSKDQTWGWQQNRAVVGHNLKIAWNLTRMNSERSKASYEGMAEKIASVMPAAGSDQQRGGWYDVMERELQDGEENHRFVWHDRKAWWQQEQAILAYLILAGVTGNQEHRRLARESAAFYNAFFLDQDSGGVYFNVLANGQPYALGTERGKGSHSMAGYHSFELAYLAAVYTNLLVTKQPMDFFFKPTVEDLVNQELRVAPDMLPAGSVKLAQVWVDGQPHDDFDAEQMIVRLSDFTGSVKVRVKLMPADASFGADLLEVTGKEATISLYGDLQESNTQLLITALEQVHAQGVTIVRLQARDLNSISSNAIRAIGMELEKFGSEFSLRLCDANEKITSAMQDSGLAAEIRLETEALATS
ncbi:Cellobiose 2-epimerase [Roseimaritima multifibrata]|uniref:Cellobiose 2-epimerase n=1 Tax=Roseimaritima multifibrata TaxID=1930274 RepID=A0A517MHW0_9BACT|nr:AGE family epimerase/isomerase [Roseimaritima multifibrata]QDS94459.1 Cellobiose 2-epimerase [Roseimaritima multifibrata]